MTITRHSESWFVFVRRFICRRNYSKYLVPTPVQDCICAEFRDFQLLMTLYQDYLQNPLAGLAIGVLLAFVLLQSYGLAQNTSQTALSTLFTLSRRLFPM